MRSLLTLVAALSLSLAVACAHKKTEVVKVDLKTEKKEEVKKEEQKADIAYTCIVNKDTRVIEMDKGDRRCEVHYTKFGDKSQVAWAESTPSICSDVFAKIRSNIEDKGFKCHSEAELAKDKDRKTASQ